jgi:iron uptake system component EfeO
MRATPEGRDETDDAPETSIERLPRQVGVARGVGLIAGLVTILAACGSSGGTAADGSEPPATELAAATPIAVAITNDGCDPATLGAAAGDVAFAVRNSSDDKGEFEIASKQPKIVVEKFLEPGAELDVPVELVAGSYEVICGSPANARAALTVSGAGGGAAAATVDQAQLAAGVAKYSTYVDEQVDVLVTGTNDLVAAIKAGDVAKAKELYAPVRAPYERIEPIAELFPDSDAAIDSRVDDHEGPDDSDFTGFHRIEEGLWVGGTTKGLEPFADKLQADVGSLATTVKTLKIEPDVMVNGAAGLIEEASQTKITGEEERYSHTDLTTFAANVDGAKQIYGDLTGLLQTADPALDTEIAQQFELIDKTLGPYRTGDTYATYDKLDAAARDQLEAALAGLSEGLSQVAGAFGLEVR